MCALFSGLLQPHGDKSDPPFILPLDPLGGLFQELSCFTYWNLLINHIITNNQLHFSCVNVFLLISNTKQIGPHLFPPLSRLQHVKLCSSYGADFVI